MISQRATFPVAHNFETPADAKRGWLSGGVTAQLGLNSRQVIEANHLMGQALDLFLFFYIYTVKIKTNYDS